MHEGGGRRRLRRFCGRDVIRVARVQELALQRRLCNTEFLLDQIAPLPPLPPSTTLSSEELKTTVNGVGMSDHIPFLSSCSIDRLVNAIPQWNITVNLDVRTKVLPMLRFCI